jgi:hypothetical protein
VFVRGVSGFLIDAPELLDAGLIDLAGVGGVLMVTPALLLKLVLGPGLTEDAVRLSVVSAESRAIFWGADLVGADSKPAFNCGGAGLFGGTPGWVCGGNWGILLDSSSLSIFFDMVSIVNSSFCTVLFNVCTSCWRSKICSPCSWIVSSRRMRCAGRINVVSYTLYIHVLIHTHYHKA